MAEGSKQLGEASMMRGEMKQQRNKAKGCANTHFLFVFQGKHISQVDDGYLPWMLKNFPESKGATDAETEKVKYNVHSLVTDLKSCSIRRDLQWGRRIHVKAVENRHESNVYVVTGLVRMYAKCRNMVDARRVFDSIHKPDLVMWNVLLFGYAENGDGLATFELFLRMKACGCAPDSVTYIAVLKACTALAEKRDGDGKGKYLKRGREIHSEIGCDQDIFVQNTLIDMYSKCGSMVDARSVFDNIQKPDVVSWTSLLLGYAENGDGFSTLDLFSRMKDGECAPNSVTYVAVIKACTSLAVNGDATHKGHWLEMGREIHCEMGSHLNHYVQNTLVDMYSKCGSIVDARSVFDSIQKPDMVSWTALLLAYAENGDGLATLDLFTKMKACGCAYDSVTYIAAIKACTSLVRKHNGGKDECLKRGKEIHSEIAYFDIFVQNTLIDMYGKCGSMVDARSVFDSIQKPDVVSWNALILGYVENEEGLTGLEIFLRMTDTRGCVPNSGTYIAALKACGLTGALSFGRKLHSEISEFTAQVVTCLVDFYAKCGSMVEACEVFELHSTARVVSTWNALLAGYGTYGDTTSMFDIFDAMQDQGFQPDAVTFVCMLSCCSHAGLVGKAREYFGTMSGKYRVTPTVMHYNCMVDILGRGNQLNEAIYMLGTMPCKPDAVTWITLLGACRKWKNVEIGRYAFQSLVAMDNKITSAYVLMAHIYSSRGMWNEQQRVKEMRDKVNS